MREDVLDSGCSVVSFHIGMLSIGEMTLSNYLIGKISLGFILKENLIENAAGI